MNRHANVAVAAAIAIVASSPVAGGGPRPQAHGSPAHQPQIHQRSQHVTPARQVVSHDVHTVQNQAHARFGGPRLEQHVDPNLQNPHRPMYSLDATNPGESHPYFQTRKDGFGYPAARSFPVYLGNGVYFIPR